MGWRREREMGRGEREVEQRRDIDVGWRRERERDWVERERGGVKEREIG